MTHQVIRPSNFSPLKADCIAQNANEVGDAKDALTWIDTLFESEDDRRFIQKAIARKVGISTHSLIRWNDESTKEIVAETINTIIEELPNEVK